MTKYIILLPDNETVWESLSECERAEVYSRHDEFSARLGEAGIRILHGAELAPSRTAKTIHRDGDSVVVTDGPYTRSAEPVTGYYLVDAASLEDLVDACSLLAGTSPVEVRPVLDSGAG